MKLYNNIECSDEMKLHDNVEKEFGVLPVPYLENSPETINISVGRQLFVDDFLIESTNLERFENRPKINPNNPIFTPEKPWETGEPERKWEERRVPFVGLFGGGVWYDGKAKKYRMWYMGSFHGNVCYAQSDDGIHFTRENLEVYEESNVVIPRGGSFYDNSAVVVNHYENNPMSEEFIMSLYVRPVKCERVGCNIYTSNDGIHWTLKAHTAGVDDTTTIFYNPFRKKWIYSIKKNSVELGRRREYADGETLVSARNLSNRRFWLRPDEKDIIHPVWKDRPELYVFNSIAYESIMLGAYTIFKGPQNDISMKRGLPKITEIHLGYSRDGFHYSRQNDRTGFISPSEKEGNWDMGYAHIASSICTIKNDELVFYYTAVKGDKDSVDPNYEELNGMYSGGAIGTATLRRDGFADMRGSGELITKKLEFDGEYLFVNTKAESLKAEILDENGKAINGFELENCNAFSGDSCKTQICWKNKESLAELKGKIIKLRFVQQEGELYSFWISKKSTGESGGYLAAGEYGKEFIQDI